MKQDNKHISKTKILNLGKQNNLQCTCVAKLALTRLSTPLPPRFPSPRSAGHLGSSNSGSMPNLAAKNGCGAGGGSTGGGGHHGVYLHSQSQPSSQYRIKEYPLYVEGSPNPVVVRSLESDQEGHYSVKAQFKTSSSYTAGGLYKETWGGEEGGEGSGRLTPSRSQIVRTPSLGRDGGGGGGGRAAVSDELRCWYQRSSGSLKERAHSHSGSNASDGGSLQGTLGHGRGSRVGTLAKGSPGETRTHTHTHTLKPCVKFHQWKRHSNRTGLWTSLMNFFDSKSNMKKTYMPSVRLELTTFRL